MSHQLAVIGDSITTALGKFLPRRPVSNIRRQLFNAWNGILAQILLSYPVPGVNLNFSRKWSTSQLNSLFLNDVVRYMLEGKYYPSIDIWVLFCRGIGLLYHSCQGAPINIHTCCIYRPYVSCNRTETSREICCITAWLFAAFQVFFRGVTNSTTEDLKLILYGAHCEKGLFTLTFYLLDHVPEDVTKFKSLDVVNASPFKNFNVHIKHSYEGTSKFRASRLAETVDILPAIMDVSGEKSSRAKPSPRHE